MRLSFFVLATAALAARAGTPSDPPPSSDPHPSPQAEPAADAPAEPGPQDEAQPPAAPEASAPADQEQAEPQGQGEGQDGGQPQPGPVEGVPAQDAGPMPMSLEDAKVNMPTVIEAFVEKRSQRGFWPLRDKSTDRLMKLKLVSIDVKKTRQAGDRLYAAPARLYDDVSGKELPVLFTVDFSGAEWQVAKMKILKPKAPARPKGAVRKDGGVAVPR